MVSMLIVLYFGCICYYYVNLKTYIVGTLAVGIVAVGIMVVGLVAVGIEVTLSE
jgi:hypothetical protein